MRLVKMALEPKDQQVMRAGCQHAWPCFGKPAIIFHDRGKIFTSARARQVLVDRLGIITEQAPPYCPSENDVSLHSRNSCLMKGSMLWARSPKVHIKRLPHVSNPL
jgi:hypothetical protein